MCSQKRTLKERILDELGTQFSVTKGFGPTDYEGLTYEQLAYHLDAHEPSIRRAARQLIMTREIHYTDSGTPVTVAYGAPPNGR